MIKMNPKKIFCGNEAEKMPKISFRIMAFMFNIRDYFSQVGKKLDDFGIKKDWTIIDYGCGTGSYLKKASELVSKDGLVYAADIHELAIKLSKQKIKKYNLKNIKPILIKGYSCNIKSHTINLIYALDMFHMIKKSKPFLKELHRLLKKQGVLIIEPGHQPMEKAKEKIDNSKLWKIIKQTKSYLKCVPKNNI